jgi:hypothetical protein
MFLAGSSQPWVHTGALHVIIAAMLVAPAYEPLARIALGLVNSAWSTATGTSATALSTSRGLRSPQALLRSPSSPRGRAALFPAS